MGAALPDRSVEQLLRDLAPQVLGATVRRFRNFAACEDATQEALIAAADQWPRAGLPQNPRGWLIQVAQRRMIDHVRSEIARRDREVAVADGLPAVAHVLYGESEVDPDDTLILLFMCCHPALTPASAIALTLRAVGGLTTTEIAKAFLVPEATVAQRISRAKRTIKESGVPFSMPDAQERAQRLGSVLHVLYLIFNEGYTTSGGDALNRTDLSNEAIRLTREVHKLLPVDPAVEGLLALMLLTDARRAARTGPQGELIPLDEQDRSLWNARAIAEGVALVSASLARGSVGEYQLQAAIAAVHDEARRAEETDWPQILALYGVLKQITDNPMVALNHAIAVAMVHGPEAGLELLAPLENDEQLRGNHRLDAVRAHLLERAGKHDAAVELYRAAALKTTSVPERNYLVMKAARVWEAITVCTVIAALFAYGSQAFAQENDDAYLRTCASCHGAELRGGETGPALIGSVFQQKWSAVPQAALENFTRITMPPTNPGSLSDADYAAVIGHIRRANGWPVVASSTVSAIRRAPNTEWLNNRGDAGSTSYSPLDQINRDNVTTLRTAWRWKADNFGPTPEFYFRVTPLMADGILYTTAGIRRTVVAIDAATGETLWMYRLEEGERDKVAPRRNSGRGVSFWRSRDTSESSRIFTISPGYQLIALDARTGVPVRSFGTAGIVDLKLGLPRVTDVNKAPVGSSSPPVIVGDVIVVGNAFSAGGAPRSKEAIPGWIRGYDVRTGALKWTFHTIPQRGEFGNDTWAGDSWQYTGNTGVWTPFSADAERGYVYLPIEAPTGDFYGGHRHGDNLFADSIVCLDAKTGKRVWHFQTLHHDIWDYDLPAPPVLVDITVNGKKIPAVAQVAKTGFTFVFDRLTGKPVWPIKEQRVPQSDVPGEKTSATQPFPTRPAPFETQGLRLEDLIDFTPEIKKQALEIVSRYRFGPLYMPPSVVVEGKNEGTLIRPNLSGGANWAGAAVDPETGILYVSSLSTVGPIGMRQDPKISDMQYVGAYGEGFPGGSLGGPFGLPLVKPPWGRITAINLNSGDHVWMVPNTDTPEWARNNPALAGVTLPRTGSFDQVGLLVTKTLLIAGEGSGLWRPGGGGNKLRAHDKATGAVLHELTLPANQSGVPMTYAVGGRQYIVVAVGAKGVPGELVALTLP